MDAPINKQSGRVVLAVVIGLIVLAGGFFAWQKLQDNHKKARQASSETRQKVTSKDTEPDDPSESGKYLVIKEWGQRFELPEQLRGEVKYGIYVYNNGDQAAYFTSNQIAERGCDLKEQTDSSGQGISGGTIAISRSQTAPEEPSGLTFTNSSGYWFTLGFSNIACYQGDTGQINGAFSSDMDTALRTLEPIEPLTVSDNSDVN